VGQIGELDSCTLTIHYVYEDETTAQPDYIHTYNYGEVYNVTSPYISGYTPSQESVSGAISEDTTITVTYRINKYTLTINYISNMGVAVVQAYSQIYDYGQSYSINSPNVPGYVLSSSNQSIISGVMYGALSVNVYYRTQAVTDEHDNFIGGYVIESSWGSNPKTYNLIFNAEWNVEPRTPLKEYSITFDVPSGMTIPSYSQSCLGGTWTVSGNTVIMEPYGNGSLYETGNIQFNPMIEVNSSNPLELTNVKIHYKFQGSNTEIVEEL
jgi:hypothetical protein